MRFATLPLLFLLGCDGCDDSETPKGGGSAEGGGGGGPITQPIGGSGGSDSCPEGTADCDGDEANGCEVPTDSDPLHCGSCSPCAVGTCSAGVCQAAQVLADGIPTVANIATDGTTLFFTSGGHAAQLYFDGKLLSLPVTGGEEPTELLGGLPQLTPEAVVLDGDSVVFSSIGTQANDGADGYIARIPKTGGEPQTFATQQRYAVQIVVHDGDYFWSASGSWSEEFLNGAIRSSEGAAAPTTFAEPDNRPSRLFVDGTHVYWSSQGTPGAEPPDGAVRRLALEGGEVETIATGLDKASAVLVAGGNIYYGHSGAIFVAPVATPEDATEFEATESIPAIFVTDGQDLYWTEAGMNGRVRRKPLAGGATILLAEGLNIPFGIALDSTNVYFTVRGTGIDDGAVMFIPK